MTTDDRSRLKTLAREWRKAADESSALFPQDTLTLIRATALRDCARELDDIRIDS